MSRSALIAGNWKMNKTVAEAERYVQALLSEGKKEEALRQVATATYFAPDLHHHGIGVPSHRS